MKLLVNKVDDSDSKPHFTSIIAPLLVHSYYGLVTITAVNVNNTFKVWNSPPYRTRHFGFKLVRFKDYLQSGTHHFKNIHAKYSIPLLLVIRDMEVQIVICDVYHRKRHYISKYPPEGTYSLVGSSSLCKKK
jgi:hypothetical protein